MLFVVHQLIPFYGGGVVATQAFQDDIAGRADAFSPGADAVHTEGLSHALTQLRRRRFPFYFFSTHHDGGRHPPVHGRADGRHPADAPPLDAPVRVADRHVHVLALLWPMLSEYRDGGADPRRCARRPGRRPASAAPRRRPRAEQARPHSPVRALMPPIVWSLFFLCVALLEGGLGWGDPLGGLPLPSAAVGYALPRVSRLPLADRSPKRRRPWSKRALDPARPRHSVAQSRLRESSSDACETCVRSA